MANAFWSGRSASIVKDAISYPFKSWELSVDRTRIDITHFGTSSWRTFLAGFNNGTIKLSGPLDTDLPRIFDADIVSIVLQIGDVNTITVDCVILKNNFKQDVDDAARYDVEAAVTGDPVFTFG